MNNSTEFTEETKPLDPKVLNNINGAGGEDDAGVVHNQELETDQEMKTDFEAIDFTSTHGLATNAKHFVRVQEICNLVFNGLRVPFCSDSFRPLVIPKSKQGVPVVPFDYYITRNGVVGGGAATFANWMNAVEEAQFIDFVLSDSNFSVAMDAKTKAKLMTNVAIWSNEYLDKGVRDTRARPTVVLGDWGWALTPTFSMTERNIRTDVFATWMYGAYVPSNPNEQLTIINAVDLRNFMNTDGGNYWPVPQNTLCLALGKMPTADLPRLALLGHYVIIDFDNSMSLARGAAAVHNGVTAYSVTLNVAVNANDFAVAKVLNNTFSGIDIQWAILANTLPLTNSSNGSIFGANTNSFNLRVYDNSICDQFINFYATKRDYGNKLPVDNLSLCDFIQSWRLFKTMIVNRSLVELGVISYLRSTATYGKDLTDENYISLISGCFEYVSLAGYGLGNPYNCALWTPYEMWICNGANLKLDDENYVDGVTGVLVNENYLVPKSQVTFTLAEWSNQNQIGANTVYPCTYYTPNRNAGINSINYGGATTRSSVGSCFPRTVPCYASTSETQTIVFDNDQVIDFAYSSSGATNARVFRKRLVFSSAVKN